MTVPEINCDNSGEYKVFIKNDGGEAESTLKIDVQLKKIEQREREFEQEQGPIMITLLKPQAIREGDSATFSTQYSAAPAPEVKWYREGREIEASDDFQITTSPTASTLFITECFMHDSGLITAKISNKYGSTSSKAALDVQVEREPENPPKWISRPSNEETVPVGKPAQFTEGTYYTLLLLDTTEADSGMYSLKAVNRNGE